MPPEEKSCPCANGKKHEAQLLDVLLATLAARSPSEGSSELRQIIFGPDGEIDKGLLGKIHNMDKGLVELQTSMKSVRNWNRASVAVGLFMMSLLVSHLTDTPKTALAEVFKPSGIEQPVTEGNISGIAPSTVRTR